MTTEIKERNIWIFHHYATPPTMNGFTRPYDLGLHFGERYKTTVFSSSYLHFSDKNLIKDKKKFTISVYNDIKFVFVKTPSSLKSGVRRVINMLSYYKNIFNITKIYATETKRPDLIIASSPHPLAMLAGIKVAKKYGIPCICEVRDFWPEVFFMGGKLKEKSVIGKLLLKGEQWIYKKADAIVFLKEGDTKYLKDKKWTTEQGGEVDLNKCHYINNGVDINLFNQQVKKNKLQDEDLTNDKFNVVYTGAIRPVNNVGNILDAAKLLKKQTNIQFLIYGDGIQLKTLEKRIIDEEITNVKIKGYVDKEYIPYILSKSSVNILNYSQDKYNWSRGNSSNKLFEYMASGKPIISTVKMGYCPLEKYNCGLSLTQHTPECLASAILQVYEMPKRTYNELSNNAKKGAKDFDYTILSKKMISVMENLIHVENN